MSTKLTKELYNLKSSQASVMRYKPYGDQIDLFLAQPHGSWQDNEKLYSMVYS